MHKMHPVASIDALSNLDYNDNIDYAMPEGDEGAYTNPMRGGFQLGGGDKVPAGRDSSSEEGEFLPASHSRHINLDYNDNIDYAMPEGDEGAYTNPMRGGFQLGGGDKVPAGRDWSSEEGEFLPASHSRHIDRDESAAGCSFWVPEERKVTGVGDGLALQVEIPAERVRVHASPVSAPEFPHCAFELNSTDDGPCRLCALLEELGKDIFTKAIPTTPLKTLADRERGRRERLEAIFRGCTPISPSNEAEMVETVSFFEPEAVRNQPGLADNPPTNPRGASQGTYSVVGEATATSEATTIEPKLYDCKGNETPQQPWDSMSQILDESEYESMAPENFRKTFKRTYSNLGFCQSLAQDMELLTKRKQVKFKQQIYAVLEDMLSLRK